MNNNEIISKKFRHVEELPEPLDEPTPKRQRKTLMDYCRKDETPSQSRETYPQFLQRYEPTDVLRRSTRGKKSNSRKEQSATGLSDARRGDGNSSQGSKEHRFFIEPISL